MVERGQLVEREAAKHNSFKEPPHMEHIGPKELLFGIVALTQVIGVRCLFRTVDRLNTIRDHLATLNGRVGTCETSRAAHDANDKEKHESCEARLHDVEKTLLLQLK